MKVKVKFWLGTIEKIIIVDTVIPESRIKDLFVDFVRKNGGGYEFQEELLTD